MKKLSLRMRLTLITVLVISAMALVLTLISMQNVGVLVVSMESAVVSANAHEASPELYYQQSQDNHVLGKEMQTTRVDEVLMDENAAGEVIYPIESFAVARDAFNTNSLLLMLAVIIAGGVTSYFVSGWALRPVRQISDEIEGISENELNIRVKQSRQSDEIGTLARSFNKLMDRMQKAFESQKAFAGAAAHELKTPLAAIRANIDVLEMEEEGADMEEYINTIAVTKKQTDRMICLVDDLFLMSMQQEYKFEDTVNIDEMIEKILVEQNLDIRQKNIKVTHQKGGAIVRANALMLHRALANIIQNAVKYNILNGRLDITSEQDEKQVKITIADTGIGIDPQKRAHIFEPFFRVDDSRSRKIGGAGLGLYIAKESIERHGGRIEVEDNLKEGKGTIFAIRLNKKPV